MPAENADKRKRGKPREDSDVTRETWSITTHPRTRAVLVRIAESRGIAPGKYLDGIFNLDLDRNLASLATANQIATDPRD